MSDSGLLITSKPRVLHAYCVLNVCLHASPTSEQFGREQKLEFSVDLKGGSVDWASKDKSSKKRVLEVSGFKGVIFNSSSYVVTVYTDWII